MTGAAVERTEEPTFEDLVAEVIDSLPDELAARVENVEIVVEDEPPFEYLQTLPHGWTLFGHYHGVPLTKRGRGYDRVLPDKISIYKGPITRRYRAPERIRAQVRKTVIHEIGHYFGIEEDRLHELGWG